MNGDKTKVLYDAISSDYDVGTLDEFGQKLQDSTKRKALYDAIGAEYDLGSFEEFTEKVVTPVDIEGKSPHIPTPPPVEEAEVVIDPEQERNVLQTLKKSAWNVFSNQIPSSAFSAWAATSDFAKKALGDPAQITVKQRDEKGNLIGESLRKWDELTPDEQVQWRADQEQDSKSVKNELLGVARQYEEKGAKYTEGLTNSLDKIKDPVDAMNWLANAVGQAVGQIPLSAATVGISSVMQETGSIYMDAVNKIAEEQGKTVEQVIDEGLDEPAIALTAGIAAAALDYVGAGKVMKTFGENAFKGALRKGALRALWSGAKTSGTESLTEGAQTAIEQASAQLSAGQPIDLDWKEIGEASAQGAAGAGGITATSAIIGKVFQGKDIKEDLVGGGEELIKQVAIAKTNGIIDDKTAQTIIKEAEKVNEADKVVPQDIPNREKVVAKIAERDEIEAQKEGVDPVFHEQFNEKTKAINEQIKQLMKPDLMGMVKDLKEELGVKEEPKLRVVKDEAAETRFGEEKEELGEMTEEEIAEFDRKSNEEFEQMQKEYQQKLDEGYVPVSELREHLKKKGVKLTKEQDTKLERLEHGGLTNKQHEQMIESARKENEKYREFLKSKGLTIETVGNLGRDEFAKVHQEWRKYLSNQPAIPEAKKAEVATGQPKIKEDEKAETRKETKILKEPTEGNVSPEVEKQGKPFSEMTDDQLKRRYDFLISQMKESDVGSGNKLEKEVAAIADERVKRQVEGKPVSKPEVVEEKFTKWRVAGSRIVANRVGDKLTQEQANNIISQLKAKKDRIQGEYSEPQYRFKDGEIKVDAIATERETNDWLQGIKSENDAELSEAQNKEKSAKKTAKAEEVKREINNNKQASDWIDETFGADVMNDFNKKELIKYLIGESDKFNGLPNSKWKSGLEKLGAIKDGKPDIKKIKEEYENKSQPKEEEVKTGKEIEPRKEVKEDLKTVVKEKEINPSERENKELNRGRLHLDNSRLDNTIYPFNKGDKNNTAISWLNNYWKNFAGTEELTEWSQITGITGKGKAQITKKPANAVQVTFINPDTGAETKQVIFAKNQESLNKIVDSIQEFVKSKFESEPATKPELNDKITKAKKRLKDANDAFKNLGAVFDPEQEAKKHLELHKALVDLAKVYIEYGIVKFEEFAKGVKKDWKDFTDEQLKKAWDEVAPKEKKESGDKKKKIITERAYEGKVRDEVKKYLEEKGLTRPVVSQEERSRQAAEFIQEYGEETAIEAVKNFDVRGGQASSILAQVLKRINRDMAKLDATDTKELDALAKEYADVAALMEKEGFSGGEFAGQLAYEYQDDELGFNVEKLIDKYKEINKGEIPAETEAKFRELARQNAELQSKIEELERQRKEAEVKSAFEGVKESIEREKKTRKEPKIYGTTRIKKGLDDLVKALAEPTPGLALASKIPSVTKALVEIGQGLIETGKANIDNVLDKIKAYLKEQNLKVDFDTYKDDVESQLKSMPTELRIPHSVLRDLVERGVDNIEDLTTEVQKLYPEATERQVRDAITGYGKVVNPNMEEIEVQIRKMKRIGRILSALEDVNNKKRPLKSGKQRDKLDAQERALNKELREAMKDLPMDEATEAEQLKTQLDAAKQRVRNQIEDLQREIDKGELIPKNARTVKEDAELKALKEKRDELKKEHEQIFKDEDFQNKKRLELTKKAAERRIEELKRRIKEKDFDPKKKKPIVADTELTRLKAEKIRVQDEYDKEFYKAELQNRKKWQKYALDPLVTGWNMTRVLSATLEWSFVLRQGASLTMSHLVTNPKVVAQAFANAAKFQLSEKKTEQWLRQVKAQEYYPTLKESKLALTEPSAKVQAREELTNSNWATLVWDILCSPFKLKSEKAFENWQKLNLVRGIERASVGYLDTLRLAQFLNGMQMLEKQGITFESNKQAYTDVADVVNTFSGRGKLEFFGLSAERKAEFLTKIFFSPRFWASQLKVATPYAFYHFGSMRAGAKDWKPSAAQKLALLNYSAMTGMTMGVILLAHVALSEDDDEETGVEFDPRSSDFLKIKLGRKRVDPWGGFIQQIVLTSRLISEALTQAGVLQGSIKKESGDILPMGLTRQTPTVGETAMRAVTNKLSPSASLVNDYLWSTVDKEGNRTHPRTFQPYSFSDELLSRLYPMIIGTTNDLLKDDPNALNGFLTFMAALGWGVSVYGEKKPKESAKPSGKRTVPKRTEFSRQ